jgi:hypothetical protein
VNFGDIGNLQNSLPRERKAIVNKTIAFQSNVRFAVEARTKRSQNRSKTSLTISFG